MSFAYLDKGQWVEVAALGFATDRGSYSPGWADAATPEERAAAGLIEIVEAVDPPATGTRLVATEIIDVGGAPTRRGVFQPIPVDDRRGALLATIRATRWSHEQGGFTGPSGHVRTDDATQGKVQGAVQLFTLNPDITTLDWEVSPGVFASLTQSDVTQMGVAIGAHVQACFTRSRQLTEAATAATTHADLDAVEAQLEDGWPA